MIETGEGELVGIVTNYFSRIGVAAFKTIGTLKEGDTVRIVGGWDTDFVQTVESMEIDHQKIQEANPGDPIGLKVNQRVRKGYHIYRVYIV